MRHILHADLDAFYASVEQLDNPRLRCKPVVVGGSPNSRGVVAAASYEARSFGIRSAMSMAEALLRCPQAIRIKPRFGRYQQISNQVMGIFREITPFVEPVSLDEAYLDVTDLVSPKRLPGLIAIELKTQIRTKTKLTISVGVATSKSVAKIASGIDKPDGLTVVLPRENRTFLSMLSVDKLSGVGPKTASRMADEGVFKIGDLASMSDKWLHARFGRSGLFFGDLARGKDNRKISSHRKRKSVSAETTLTFDSSDASLLLDIVVRLSDRVMQHLLRHSLHGKTVRIKLRLSDYSTFTRQRTVVAPLSTAEEISNVASELLYKELYPRRLVRLIGVGVSGFTHFQNRPTQPRLTGFD